MTDEWIVWLVVGTIEAGLIVMFVALWQGWWPN